MRADHRSFLLRRHNFSPGLFSTTFQAPRLAREIAPGQFVMLRIGDSVRPYLRRAYSVADADAGAGEIELLVKAIGRGTRALEEAPVTFPVDLLGPLGNGFSVAGVPAGARVAIVAGGIGVAPFPLLLRSLERRGVSADLFLGGRTEADLAIASRFEGLVGGDLVLATEDGSLGEKGLITRVFETRARGRSYARVYSCGPMPMFAALAKILGALGLAAEFSTEAEMGCGFGACLGCVIPGTDKPFLVSCMEGPVLAPEKIAWPA
ncbi:MAG: dihydroorotate dehydrogenase electron transfer subunit [Thermoanaerobaculia bacterium]